MGRKIPAALLLLLAACASRTASLGLPPFDAARFVAAVPIAAASENHVVSPTGLQRLVVMLSLGAKGTTRSELASLGGDPSRVAGAQWCHDAVWLDTGFHPSDQFKADLTRYLGADTYVVHMSSPATISQIESWINDKTGGRISSVPIPALSVSVAVDALHYKGRWKMPFDPKKTRSQSFYSPTGVLSVPMMGKFLTLKHRYGPRYESFALPLADGLEMIVALPNERDGKPGVRDGLDAAKEEFIASDRYVEIPRFDVRTHTDLVSALQALGVKKAFSPAADFSPMLGVAGQPLSDVFTDVDVRVDETGAEAAAATVAVITLGATRPLRVDHPFAFAIVDPKSKAALVAGVVNRP